MHFINKEHFNLIKEMLDSLSIKFEKSIEAVSTKEIVTALMSKVNRDGVDKLLSYLEKHDYYTAPASTRFHGNHEGGLAEHSINVCALLFKENRAHNAGLSDETIIISALMHDLCKVDFYAKDFKNVKTYINEENEKDLKGFKILYEKVAGQELRYCWVPTEVYVTSDQMPLPHGSKSLYILQGFIKVTREEAFLITWHMGPYGNVTNYEFGFNDAVAYQPTVALMYVADFLASSLYEVTK